MGINHILELFKEKYYEDLEGGILESFGRLFRNSVKLFIYPMRQGVYARYLAGDASPESCPLPPSHHPFASNVMITAKNLQVSPRLQNLYQHLLENHYIECAVGYDESIADCFSRDGLRKIRDNDDSWEPMVPPEVAALIKERGLFGYGTAEFPSDGQADELQPGTANLDAV